VAGFGCPNEIIVGNLELLPQLLETHDRPIAVLLRVDAVLCGGLLDLLAVLIRPGKEECRAVQKAVVTGQNIGQNRGIGMADVWLIIDVVDRRCDVEHF